MGKQAVWPLLKNHVTFWKPNIPQRGMIKHTMVLLSDLAKVLAQASHPPSLGLSERTHRSVYRSCGHLGDLRTSEHQAGNCRYECPLVMLNQSHWQVGLGFPVLRTGAG